MVTIEELQQQTEETRDSIMQLHHLICVMKDETPPNPTDQAGIQRWQALNDVDNGINAVLSEINHVRNKTKILKLVVNALVEGGTIK